MFRAPGSHDLVLVPIDGGRARLIKQLDRTTFGERFRISPDGRSVVFDRLVPGEFQRDVFVLSVDSGREDLLVTGPADDRVLSWSPDGDRILFASDRLGSLGIWAVRVVNGRAQSELELIKRDTPSIAGSGFTTTGDFYYSTSETLSEVYIATIDPATGNSTGRPARIDGRFASRQSGAVLSPDGTQLAYMWTQPPSAGSIDPRFHPSPTVTLEIQTISTGNIRLLTPALREFGTFTWLPDGRSFIGSGKDASPAMPGQRNMEAGKRGLFLVDVANAGVTRLAVKDPAPGQYFGDDAVVSSDGKRVFFTRISASPRRVSLASADLTSGAEQELISLTSSIDELRARKTSLSLSPDGRWLAVLDMDQLFVVPSTGGEPRLVASLPGTHFGVTWSSDGQFLFCAIKDPDRGRDLFSSMATEVWRIPLDGTAPRKTGITWPGSILRISAHPDGRRLVLSAARIANETWVLQNVAPVRR